jgi:hypothetical protein
MVLPAVRRIVDVTYARNISALKSFI